LVEAAWQITVAALQRQAFWEPKLGWNCYLILGENNYLCILFDLIVQRGPSKMGIGGQQKQGEILSPVEA